MRDFNEVTSPKYRYFATASRQLGLFIREIASKNSFSDSSHPKNQLQLVGGN